MAIYDVSTTEKKAAPSLVAGGTLYADSPIGTILPFGGSTPPAGFMLCDGTAISRTTYSELFAVIGESFGAGDGSTTFNLPDMREAVPKGAGLTGNSSNHMDADGLEVGEFIDDRTMSEFGIITTGSGSYIVNNSSGGGTYYKVSSNRHGATTEVKSVGVNYIIKAKMIAVPADFLAKVQPKTLDTPLTIGGTSQTTVEGALGALNDEGGKKVQYTNTQTNDITVDALNITKPTILKGSGASYTGTIPKDGIAYGCFLVIPRNTNKHVLAYGNKFVATITYNGTSWGDWVVFDDTVIHRVNPTTNVDCNDLTDYLVEYRVGGGDANRPTTDSTGYILRTFRTSESTATYSQIAYQIGGTNIYRRSCTSSGVWSSWVKLVTGSDLSYSTSETNTGKTWIDGKPIYRKVVDLGALPNNTIKYVPHGISNLSKVVSLTGMASNASYSLVLPHVSNSNFSVEIEIEGANIDISVLSDMSGYTSSFVVIEYTKTTD